MMLNHGVVLRYVDGPGRKKRVEMFADLGWAHARVTQLGNRAHQGRLRARTHLGSR